jgi:hypothetical protein
MIKSILSTVAISAFFLAAAPAFAADCATEMKTTEAMMTKTTDAAKKEMAMKEMTMAKDMMDKKDEAGCMMHTGEAMKALK